MNVAGASVASASSSSVASPTAGYSRSCRSSSCCRSANTTRASAPRSTPPSARRAAENASCTRRCTAGSDSSSIRTVVSESITRAPSSRRIAATVDLPAPILPVSPMTGGLAMPTRGRGRLASPGFGRCAQAARSATPPPGSRQAAADRGSRSVSAWPGCDPGRWADRRPARWS